MSGKLKIKIKSREKQKYNKWLLFLKIIFNVYNN